METTTYDYIIIGGGLAGLQLAIAFSNDLYFEEKSIAIIEPSEKIENDKTWSFWEIGRGNWEKIIHHQWDKGTFETNNKTIQLTLGKYRYKSIRSEDFYNFAKEKLEVSSNIIWIKDEVKSVKDQICIGKNGEYEAKLIFDSRISSDFLEDKEAILIQQHFKGWIIETNENYFDPTSFVMMDYSVNYKNLCCFTYVLPYSEKTALVEFTFFTPELVKQEVYDALLKKYLSERLRLTEYNIKEIEFGIIPMSTFPFQKDNREGYLRIGTGGGWVKASSGYSFKSTERKVEQVIQNIKNETDLAEGLFKKRFAFYDRIFLRVLQNENHLGNELFECMYTQNTAESIFRFLDEETTLFEEIQLINSFKKAPFLRSLRKDFS